MPRDLAREELDDRLKAIRLIVLDVDGVLTDGVIAIDDQGVETKHFHVRDGSAIALWRKAGGRVAILSGRKAECVNRRAAELGIEPVVQGVSSKFAPLQTILEKTGISAEQTLFMGDDWADLQAMQSVGVAACPADAAVEVRAIAHQVVQSAGGRGAVREMIEQVLRAQGRFEGLIATFRPTG